MLGFFKTQ